MRIDFKEGFYEARGYIADAIRCVNLYPEKNPEDSPAPYSLYQTPGLAVLGSPPSPAGAGRCLYTATNGNLYGVVGQTVYAISMNWGFSPLGTLLDVANTPVSMQDNHLTIAIVDGSPRGYQIDLATNAYSQIVDPAFYGADKVDYLDTFLLFNRPGTNQFYSTLSNQIVPFDPTYIAAKAGYPDSISTLLAIHRELLLLGSQLTTEVWFDAGNTGFPFAIVPGVFIEHGCIAKYSVAKHDLFAFWLGIDRNGKGTVMMYTGYQVKKISTPALAAAISKYGTISDAIGMTYKQQDHIYYMLTFPKADKTWVFDLGEGLWHERVWNDPQGNEHRTRHNCMALAYGKNISLDWQTGDLYSIDQDVFTDAGQPIIRRRGFKHITNDGKRVVYDRFTADFQMGVGQHITMNPWSPGWSNGWGPNTVLDPGNLYLRWSDTRGKSFGEPVAQPLGFQGEYLRQPQWRNLGLARDRVFELFWSSPYEYVLQGAWADATPSDT